MEELLVKVSDLLGMSVDGLMNYYPELRSQMAWFGVLDTISSILLIILITSPITLMMIYMAVDMADYYFWDKHMTQSLVYKVVITLIIIAGFATLTYALKYVFATDIMMIRYLFIN